MVQAWYMNDSNEDQREEHHQYPPKFIEINELYKLTGVEYFKIDNRKEEDVKGFEKLRFERGYTYEDEVTVSKDKLPNYDEMLEIFFKEHLHMDEEIRYILEGSGYFDVRDPLDKWIRVKTEASDMIILPSGIYHRFTIDTNNYIKAKRYFIGEPVWTQYNRPADDMEVRSNYIKKLKEGFN